MREAFAAEGNAHDESCCVRAMACEPKPRDFVEQGTRLGQLLAVFAGLFVLQQGVVEKRRETRFRRAKEFDSWMERLGSSPKLRLALAILDWETRAVEVEPGVVFEFTNVDVLLAIRTHDQPDGSDYSPAQIKIRDALDALLEFFDRLHIALTAGLLEPASCARGFSYWLERLLGFDEHQVDGEAQASVDDIRQYNGSEPRRWLARYVIAYGNSSAIISLADAFGLGPLAVTLREEEAAR